MMTMDEFYRWLHTVDWTTSNDPHPVNPKLNFNEAKP